MIHFWTLVILLKWLWPIFSTLEIIQDRGLDKKHVGLLTAREKLQNCSSIISSGRALDITLWYFDEKWLVAPYEAFAFYKAWYVMYGRNVMMYWYSLLYAASFQYLFSVKHKILTTLLPTQRFLLFGNNIYIQFGVLMGTEENRNISFL